MSSESSSYTHNDFQPTSKKTKTNIRTCTETVTKTKKRKSSKNNNRRKKFNSPTKVVPVQELFCASDSEEETKETGEFSPKN